ncbi:DNA-binding response regulator [Curtobacterium sp. MCPF17_047]|nr:DNA-binding response regulator [Curtobacterium sp. MCPF17_047]
MGGLVRVALVDDQLLVRDGFARIIRAQADMEVVGLGANGRDAIDLVRSARPDVLVIDIRMPVLDGISAIREIMSFVEADALQPRILVVTTFNLDEYVFEALRAGASGFLLKDSTPRRLLDAIRTLASGEAIVDPTVTRDLIGAFAGRIKPVPTEPPGRELLTPREQEVLRLLAQGMSNAEIAAAMFVTRETAKTYVSRILLKLGLRDRVQAVVYAYRNGIAE